VENSVLNTIRQALAAVACALVCTSVRGEIVTIQWTPSGTFARKLSIAPAKFAEVCGPLAVGEQVRWRFRADRPLDFNVHYHVGKDVVYPVRQDGAIERDGVLAVSRRDEYCWMWTNPGTTTAQLDLTLSR